MRALRVFIKDLVCFKPWRMFFAVFLMVITGAMEGASLLLLQPLLQFTNLGVKSTGKTTVFHNIFKFINFHGTLLEILSLYVFIVATLAALNYLQNRYNQVLQFRFAYNLQQKLYTAFIRTPWSCMAYNKRSDLNELLTKESESVSFGVAIFIQMVSVFILTLVYLITASLLSWQLTIIAVICGLLIYFVLHYKSHAAYRVGQKTYDCFKKFYSLINEHFLGAKLAKAYRLEERFEKHFKEITREVVKQSSKFISLQASTSLVYTTGGALAFSIIFYFSVKELHVPLVTLFVLLIIFARLIPKITMFQKNHQHLANTLVSFQAVQDMTQRFLDAGDDVRFHGNDVRSVTIKESISLKNICFSYDGNNKNTLFSNLNLTIPAKKITAIVGSSGAGKSTLIDMIIGLLKPLKGEILLDGKPLEDEYLQMWANSIGYVPQNDCLLNDSVRNNLTWVADKVDDEKIAEILKMVNVYDVVQKLPGKLDTILGDDGVRLSGGERQRLMLARALLREPTLLILDEATNALDAENEAAIFDTIYKLRNKVTIIVVTHRNTVLKWVDKKVVMEDGKIG